MTDNKAYPTFKVLLPYTFLGGALGGFLLWLANVLFDNSPLDNWFLTALIGGSIVGIIPAFFTGIVLFYQKRVLKNAGDYLKVFLTGFIVTALYSAILALLTWGFDERFTLENNIQTGRFVLLIGSIGGLSSLILGRLILPKKS